MKQYLLTGEKWIPVLRRGGGFAEVSLLELFEKGNEIVDLSVPPAQRVALMRFLLCIVARSLPLPRNRREWESAGERIIPQAVAYLKKWELAFDLYGEHPFLQIVGLEKDWNTTLDKLDFTLASGHNHTLFDHSAVETGRPHSSAWQARMLLVTQNFSPSGMISPNRWNGMKNNDLTGNIASPALEGSPLHTFLLGDNLSETLHLNLIPQEELGSMEIGIPVWEQPPENVKDLQKFKATLLGRLTPVSRAVRLPEKGEAASLAVACNYAQISEFIDPYLANRRNEKKKTLSYVRIQPERHPWRELESLLALQPESSRLLTPPKHLLNRNWVPADKQLRLWCGGVFADKAKYKFSGEWLISFREELLSRDEFWNAFGHFVQDAEAVAGLLRSAIGMFWTNLGKAADGSSIKIEGGKKTAQEQALLGFWRKLDSLVPAFLASAEESGGDFRSLYEQLRETAESFFLRVLPDQSPRGIMACAITLPYFRRELKHILGNNIAKKGEQDDGK